MRTYSRADWAAAQEQWRDFSSEWREVRHQAAMRGLLYPPAGTALDSWEDDKPSQRAILIRAIRETPALLQNAISRSRSWGDVIAQLVRARDDWRDRLNAEDRAVEREKADWPDHREAAMTVKAILDRIGAS